MKNLTIWTNPRKSRGYERVGKMSKTTCGPLYADGLRHYAGDNQESIRLFAAGFVSGEAEKVYLGAAQGAMFRPSAEYRDMVMSVVRDVVARYDLQMAMLGQDEIWLLRDDNAYQLFRQLLVIDPNTPAWHIIRGQLCGVPISEIDVKFHERKGYGERAD